MLPGQSFIPGATPAGLGGTGLMRGSMPYTFTTTELESLKAKLAAAEQKIIAAMRRKLEDSTGAGSGSSSSMNPSGAEIQIEGSSSSSGATADNPSGLANKKGSVVSASTGKSMDPGSVSKESDANGVGSRSGSLSAENGSSNGNNISDKSGNSTMNTLPNSTNITTTTATTAVTTGLNGTTLTTPMTEATVVHMSLSEVKTLLKMIDMTYLQGVRYCYTSKTAVSSLLSTISSNPPIIHHHSHPPHYHHSSSVSPFRYQSQLKHGSNNHSNVHSSSGLAHHPRHLHQQQQLNSYLMKHHLYRHQQHQHQMPSTSQRSYDAFHSTSHRGLANSAAIDRYNGLVTPAVLAGMIDDNSSSGSSTSTGSPTSPSAAASSAMVSGLNGSSNPSSRDRPYLRQAYRQRSNSHSVSPTASSGSEHRSSDEDVSVSSVPSDDTVICVTAVPYYQMATLQH